jgi:hypothetical protein
MCRHAVNIGTLARGERGNCKGCYCGLTTSFSGGRRSVEMLTFSDVPIPVSPVNPPLIGMTARGDRSPLQRYARVRRACRWMDQTVPAIFRKIDLRPCMGGSPADRRIHAFHISAHKPRRVSEGAARLHHQDGHVAARHRCRRFRRRSIALNHRFFLPTPT